MTAPASKYHTHRALILAALAEGTSSVSGISKSLDNLSTMRCLTALGTEYVPTETGFDITGRPFHTPADILDCGNSGSTIHFLLPVTATAPGTSVYTGDESLRSRPMGPLIKACHEWGIDVWSTQENGRLPIVIRGCDVTKLPDHVTVNGLISPWASGLILLSPFTGHDVTVAIEDGKLNEASYTDLMIQMMLESINKYQEYDAILYSLFAVFFAKLLRFYENTIEISSSRFSDSRKAYDISAYIEEHHNSVTLNSLAAHFGYTPEYTSRLIRKITGSSFMELLIESRMKHAIALLKSTSLPVSNVANAVGYESTENFIRVFKKRYSMTPSAYRRTANKNMIL